MGNLKNDDKLTAFIAFSDHTGIGTLCGGGAIWKLSRSAAGGSLPVTLVKAPSAIGLWGAANASGGARGDSDSPPQVFTKRR